MLVIMLLLLCRTWPHLFVPRQLLLLPFSASDVTNKLLDIALGPQAPPAAQRTTSPCVLRPGGEVEQSPNTCLLNFFPASTNSTSSSALDSMMQVDVASPTTAMFELLGSMDAGPSSVPFSAVTGSAPTTTAFAAATTPSTDTCLLEFSLSVQTDVLRAPFGVSPQPGNPPSFSQISAVALLLTSLPSHFHTPIYERAMLLFKQHPLLAPTPMDEEVSLLTPLHFSFSSSPHKQRADGGEPCVVPTPQLPPGAGPFSCYSFTDYTSNVSSMLDNLPNRGLCLMHNFFLYGTVENFAIYPNFIRCVHDGVLCVVFATHDCVC